MKKLLLFCMVLLTFHACNDEDDPGLYFEKTDSLTFTADGKPLESNQVIIRSQWRWKLTPLPDQSDETDWVKFNMTSGLSDETLFITVTHNFDESRKATFQVTADNKSITLTIYQQGSGIIDIFPDPAFRKFCLQKFDKNWDSNLSEEELLEVKEIYLSRNLFDKSFGPLKGIERFINLEVFSNQLEKFGEVDFSGNKELRVVRAPRNFLIGLDLSQNKKIEELNFETNLITELDLSPNPNLRILNCCFNPLNKLNVNNCPNLETLWCIGTELTTLDISNNPNLKDFRCMGNPNLKTIYVWKGFDVQSPPEYFLYDEHMEFQIKE